MCMLHVESSVECKVWQVKKKEVWWRRWSCCEKQDLFPAMNVKKACPLCWVIQNLRWFVVWLSLHERWNMMMMSIPDQVFQHKTNKKIFVNFYEPRLLLLTWLLGHSLIYRRLFLFFSICSFWWRLPLECCPTFSSLSLSLSLSLFLQKHNKWLAFVSLKIKRTDDDERLQKTRRSTSFAVSAVWPLNHPWDFKRINSDLNGHLNEMIYARVCLFE